MAITLTSRLMDNLRINLPGALDGNIKLELWNVIDEFCRTAGAWREIIDVTLVQGQSEYDVAPPAGSEIVHILEATHNGRPIKTASDGSSSPVATMRGRIAPDTLGDNSAEYNPDNAQGLVEFAVYSPQFITIETPPTQEEVGYPLKVLVTLTPLIDVTDQELDVWVPDWFWSKYFQALKAGTMGYMMAQVAKPYSNERIATAHLRKFRNLMALARPETQRNGVAGAQPWRFPRFT